MKLNTVNVIERTDERLYSVRSFADNDEGNKEAEEFFVSIMKEMEEISEDDLEICLDEGFYENGNYELALVHG